MMAHHAVCGIGIAGECDHDQSLTVHYAAGPHVARLQCYVEREKHHLTGHIYRLYIHDPSRPQHPLCVLAARRRVKSKAPMFLVVLGGSDDELSEAMKDLKKKASEKVIAVLHGNNFGTSYHLDAAGEYGDLASLADAQLRPGTPTFETFGPTGEHVAIRFRQDGLAALGGVRRFSVAVADPTHGVQPDSRLSAELEAAGSARSGTRCSEKGICILQSMMPRWDTGKKEYVMDFGGRVAQGSPKNCRLEWPTSSSGEAHEPVFIFGKEDKDTYVMDFSYPFNLLQAFGTAIACFDTRSFAST